MSDAFRKFLRSRGRPANYSAKVLSQALAAARRKRGTEATQYAQQRAWIEANRPRLPLTRTHGPTRSGGEHLLFKATRNSVARPASSRRTSIRAVWAGT